MDGVARPLDGRVAVVTGSGRNIGRAIALALARAGAAVVVNGHRDLAAIEGVAAEIAAAGGQALPVLADVSDDDAVRRMVEAAEARFGGLDIAVGNVGLRPFAPFLDITPDDWDRVLRTNLSAAFFLARHAIPRMQARGWGRIVHVSGFTGFWSQIPGRAHAITAKAALHGLTKAIAREFGPAGITANTVAPGAVDTARDWSQYRHQPTAKVAPEIPVGRYGLPEEIAAAVLHLASPEAAYTNGAVLHVNGGHFMY